MWVLRKRLPTLAGLTAATCLAFGLLLGAGGPILHPSRATAGEPGGSLQAALARTQQDLMNLKSNLQTEGRTSRPLAVEDLRGILRVLEKAVDRASSDDPCFNAAQQTRGFLIALIEATANLRIPGRKALAEELELLIGVMDGYLGKW